MRDARKGAAFASGMRGREKPKVADAHGSTKNPAPTENPLGNERQEPGKSIGAPGGVDHTDPVYSSGMRGLESGKQKKAGGSAQYGQTSEGKGGGENKQGPDAFVGNPDGDNTAKKSGPASGIGDEHLRSAAKGAYKMGIPGNNTEQAATGGEPIGAEEDDTHINIRVPKHSITKRKGAGQAV